MPFDDLAAFLRCLEAQGELVRVRAPVDPVLEITEIAGRVVRQGGPALLFESVRGAAFPLVINLFGSRRRLELALGCPPAQLGAELAAVVERLTPPSLGGLWRSRQTLRRLLNGRVRPVRRAPVQEVSEPPDLGRLPALQCWPGDGGRFLTLPLVLTQDPLTGRRNLGVYRLQVFGPDRTGLHWQIQKGGGFHYAQAERLGQPLPVAVVLGGDPALLLAAVAPLPEPLDELVVAGVLRGRPTPVVAAQTVPLLVPANAEFVLEGWAFPGERALEGPFGDHFGHYSAAAPFPVLHLRRLTRRRRAIYPAAVVGRPPQEDTVLGEAMTEVFAPLVRLVQPEVRDLWAYAPAGFHNLLVAAVRVRYTKEALKAGLGLLGQGQLSLTKCLILVDEEVNPRDFGAVLRAIRAYFDPRHDFTLLPATALDTLDFTSGQMHLGSKMILDATRGGTREPGLARPAVGGEEAPPPAPSWDPRTVAPTVRAWRLWADTLLAVRVESHARAVLEQLVQACPVGGPSLIVAVSPDVDLHDDTDLLWGIFTRFDPARDVLFREVRWRGAWPEHHGPLAIDATWKPGYPAPLAMSDEVRRLVDRRWREYWST